MKKHLSKRLYYNKPLTVFLAFFLCTSILKAELKPLILVDNEAKVSQQNLVITVKGVIVDKNGEPIIGASVVEKGVPSNGTISDLDGKFSLKVSGNAILEVIYIGYQGQALKANESMKITLLEDQKVLDEVIVMGYGVQKKKLVTGATIQVKGDDIAKLNTVNAIEALQSQAPGVNIVQTSGFIGSGFKVNIRGLGSNTSSSPLYVIDGVAGGSIDGLNPNDIEAIDVLKDGATAAIYGARAANGVILVTTKQGKAGKTQISYDGYYGVQNLYKIPTILNAQEFMSIQDEARIMDGLSPYNWATYIPTQIESIKNGTWQGTNWLKESINNDAPVQNHSLNFTGGTDMSTYATALSYTQQEATIGTPGAMPALNRYNVRINSTHVMKKLNGLDFLKMGETLNYKYQEMQGSMGTSGIYWNSMHNLLIMSPLMPAYNEDGGYYAYVDQKADKYNWDISNGANKNPIAYSDYVMNHNRSKSHYLQSSIYLNLQPIKNLNIKTQFGYIMGASSSRAYIPSYEYLTETMGGGDDQVTQSQSSYNRWSWENTANYVFKLDDHNFDVLAGTSVEKWGLGESMSVTNKGSSYDDFDHAYLSNVQGVSKATISGAPYTPGRIASFFGRINYNYMEKYMASFIMRADGSSNFSRGNRWGYFPSVSLGWTITGEKFMEDVNWVEFLKLRASYGQNGNSDIGAFQYLQPIAINNGYGGYPFGGSMGQSATGAYPTRLRNPDVTWETQTSMNIGLDARFLNGRLGLILDWYERKTKDWLLEVPVLKSVGFGTDVYKNAGGVKNTGFEVAVNWNDNIQDFTYGANLSLGHNKNKVTQINNEEGKYTGDISVFWEGQDAVSMLEVGKPMGYFYGYASDGIFQNQKQIDEYTGAFLNGRNKTVPGDVIWIDTNNDNVINADDRTDIGNPHPDLTVGFSFNVGWKGLDLSVTTYSAIGQEIMKCYRDFSSSPNNNYTTDIFKRWHGEGTSNKLPRLSSASNSNWNRTSDIYVENGDYLKIKNITIGYDFKPLFKKLPAEQLRLFLTAQNLFTFTGYSGMDPEIGYGGTQGWASGLDLGFYPSARTFMLGANIKF